MHGGLWLLSPPAEKVSSLGKDWHKFCLKCERCSKTLTPGGHAEVSLPLGLGWGHTALHTLSWRGGQQAQAPSLTPCPVPLHLA